MSTAETKRPWAQAKADGIAFRDLFPAACYVEWKGAGSVRRNRPEVSDIEHVIRPAFGEVEKGGGLFAEKVQANLLWHRLDELVAAGTVAKAIYGATGYRWGEKYRGVMFRGFRHELFAADADNWGSVLAIRTGPADYSKGLVTGLLRNGYRNQDGYVWTADPGGNCVERISVPTEESFFRLAGIAYVEPEKRI